jgi:predicted permease
MLAHSAPMSDAFILLPDLTLILCGLAICRFTPLNRPLWEGVERLVYYVLFPCLLFSSILKNPLSPAAVLPLAGSGLALVFIGIVLSNALAWWPGVDARLHASGAQTAFRFNSYVLLALAERLAGMPGVTWAALLLSVCVPLCNVGAVWPLARHGGHGYLREIVRNPLILATAAGLTGNVLGLHLPALASLTLGRIGAAALPLGLMAVGAGLQFGALKKAPALAAAFMGMRHLLLPALGITLALLLKMPPQQQAVLVAFAALPTASSCYVLAARMGGDGGFVAGLVTLSTLIGMLGLPLALLAWSALQGR